MRTKMLITLLFITLSLVLGFTPATDNPVDRLSGATRALRYSKAVTDDADRLKTIVAETYSTAASMPLFTGEAGSEATALLLYAVMYHESGLRPHIEHCDCTKGDGTCDNGHAFGLPQLHAEWLQGHGHDEVCSDRPLQVRLARDLLFKTRAMCKGSPERWVAAYHSGNDCTVSGYSHNVNEVFVTLLQKSKIQVKRDYTGWSAVYATSS